MIKLDRRMGSARGTPKDLRPPKNKDHIETVQKISALQLGLPQRNNHRRKPERFGRNGLGRTTRQRLKPISFAIRFISDTERENAINEIELLAMVWALEQIRLYIYGQLVK